MSLPGVCLFCRDNIFSARVSWNYHHPGYASLKNSAHRQCVFCILLFEDVTRHYATIEAFCSTDESKEQTMKRWLHLNAQKTEHLPPSDGSPTALYRWSVRSLGRTREGKVMVAVTFRVVPKTLVTDHDTHTDQGLQTFDLPERVFYCFPEADLPSLLSPAELGTSTNPNINDGQQIKDWIRTCGIEHKHCPKRAGAGSKFVPTRLLHIGGKRRGQPIRVVDTKANNVKGPYVTLSHCWGTSSAPRPDTLLLGNLDQFMSVGVPWNYLSRNFRQAIDVARFLEVDYIWIDSRRYSSSISSH